MEIGSRKSGKRIGELRDGSKVKTRTHEGLRVGTQEKVKDAGRDAGATRAVESGRMAKPRGHRVLACYYFAKREM